MPARSREKGLRRSLNLGVVMRWTLCFAGSIAALVAAPLTAQEANSERFSPAIIGPCSQAEQTGSETYYNECFDEPDGLFYGRAYTYFSMENTDLQGLIKDSGRRNGFWNALKDLIISNDDTAFVVMRVSALNASDQKVSLGTVPFLRILREGRRRYSAVRIPYDGSLPPRFLADADSELTFEIGVLLEREGESRIAQLLGRAAQLTGITVPTFGQLTLTDRQAEFLDIDQKISDLISFRSEISTILPLKFRENERNAFETSTALGQFLPEDAGVRIIVAAYPQQSIFPLATVFQASENSGLAIPGGSFATEVRTTSVGGTNIFEALVAKLGIELATTLRFGEDPDKLETACQALSFYSESSAVPLTSDDRFRLEWALMSGNQTLSNAELRNSSCIKAKEQDWARLGLGLPDLEEERLPPELELIKQKAAEERDEALEVFSQALAMRDQARTMAEQARSSFFAEPVGNKAGSAFFAGQINPIYKFSGRRLQEDAITSGLGVLEETFSEREGNLYEGQVTINNGQVVLQGLGQYTSIKSIDNLGFKEYVGNFESNLGTGHGRILSYDGAEYLGETSREQPHGFGIVSCPDESLVYGRFFDGLLRGKAVLIDPDKQETGVEYDGNTRPCRAFVQPEVQ